MSSRGPACAAFLVLALGACVRADDREGSLALDGGQVVLRGPDGRVRARGTDVGRVTLSRGRKVFRAAPAHVALLSADEHVTGVLLGSRGDTTFMRTAWADRLAVPLPAILGLTHPPGRRTILHETFAARPERPARGAPSRSLAVTPALAAGAVSVLFEKAGKPTAACWVAEADFVEGKKVRTVRISLAGDGNGLVVDPGGLRGTARAVNCSAGPHKLTVEFSTGSLRLVCDDLALWYTLEAGPGRLGAVRLDGTAGGAKVSSVVVEAAEPARRRPAGDPKRDELWLAEGDQVFGLVRRADASGVEIAGPFGARSYAWKELRGWYPRRRAAPPAAPVKGPRVRLEVDSGLRQVADVLDGTLTAVDARRVTIRHAALGELTIPRVRVLTVRPLAGP